MPALQIWPNLLSNRCTGPSSRLLPISLFVWRRCMQREKPNVSWEEKAEPESSSVSRFWYFVICLLFYVAHYCRWRFHCNDFQTSDPSFFRNWDSQNSLETKELVMLLPRDLSWLPGRGQVSYPAFAEQGRWAEIPRERSCLDPSKGVVFWKLLSKWVSGAISQGTGACQREEQIVLLFLFPFRCWDRLFTILKYVTSLGKLFFD